MSDLALDRAPAADGAFTVRVVAVLILVGLFGFFGMLLLGAYGPDMKSGRNGGAHALSNGATGYRGLIQLAEATGRHPRIVRTIELEGTEDLLVLTPEHGFVPLGDILLKRRNKPTLVIYPKWSTETDPRRRGWVRRSGLLDADDPEYTLAPGFPVKISRVRSGGRALRTAPELRAPVRFAAPRPLQALAAAPRDPKEKIAASGWQAPLHPLITDRGGRIVLGQLGNEPHFVLADPDLLSNLGMRDARQAESALALLDWMNSTGAESIMFDVTLNGFGTKRNLLKLAFQPPALPMTLTLLIAGLLVGFHALGRFGSPRRRERALALGKRALVDSAAGLIRTARREPAMGARYVQLVREQAQLAFGVPARLKEGEIDQYLDRLQRPDRFTALAGAALRARDRAAMLAAAQDLHTWLKERA